MLLMVKRKEEGGSGIPNWVWLITGIIILVFFLLLIYSLAGGNIIQAIPNQT